MKRLLYILGFIAIIGALKMKEYFIPLNHQKCVTIL